MLQNFFKFKLAAVYILCLAVRDPKVSGPVELFALDDSTACAVYRHRTTSDTDTK